MTPNNTSHNCIHEDKWGHTEAQVERLETKHEYNQDLIKQMIEDNRRFEEKLDKKLDTINKKQDNLSKELNEFKLESNKGDTTIDLRLTAVETELELQKEVTKNNYTKLTSIGGVISICLIIFELFLKYGLN